MTHAELAELFLEREFVTPAIDEALIASQEATGAKDRAHLLWIAGHALYLKRQSPEAIPYLTEATELDPQHQRAWSTRGMALADIGKTQAGLDDLRRAYALDPSEPTAALELGHQQQRSKQFAEVVETLTPALARDPQHKALRVARAKALLELGRKDEATEDLIAAATHDDPYAAYLLVEKLGYAPQTAEILGAWAYDREKRRKTDEAVAAYRDALAADARDPDRKPKLVGRLATLLRVAKRNDEAKQVLDEWLDAHPGDLVVAERRAWHHYQLSQDDACEAQYLRMLELDSNNTAALVGLAQLYGVTKRGEQGLALAERALEQDRWDRNALFHGAVCAALANKGDRSRELFDEALRLGHATAAKHRRHYFGDETPDDVFSAALTAGGQGNKVGAAEGFEKAAPLFEAQVRVKGDSAWRYWQKSLGNVAYWYSVARQNMDRAESVARQVAADYPAHYDTLITLGNLLRNTERAEQARDWFTKAIELNPSEGRGFFNRGQVAIRASDPEAARSDFAAAARLYTRKEWQADAHFWHARALEALDRPSEAYDAYNRAVELGNRGALQEAVRLGAQLGR